MSSKSIEPISDAQKSAQVTGSANETTNTTTKSGSHDKFEDMETEAKDSVERQKMYRDKQGRLKTMSSVLMEQDEEEPAQPSKADEIIKMFKEQVFASSVKGSLEERAHRATKIICTIGEQNMTTSKIKELMQAGMDVARLNMDYFEPNMMSKLISNVHTASDQLANSCPIFIDLKGMLIRTMMDTKPI